MSHDTKEHKVKCVVYKSKIKLVIVFWYSLKNNDIILQRKEAFVSKGFIAFFFHVLVNGFFTLFEQFELFDFASMAFYHRLLLLLAGLLLFGLEGNSQGKAI